MTTGTLNTHRFFSWLFDESSGLFFKYLFEIFKIILWFIPISLTRIYPGFLPKIVPIAVQSHERIYSGKFGSYLRWVQEVLEAK